MSHHKTSYLKVILSDKAPLGYPAECFRSSYIRQWVNCHETRTFYRLFHNHKIHLLALLGLITDLNDRIPYPYTSTSEIYPFIYLNFEKRTSFRRSLSVQAIIGLYPTRNFTPSIPTSWVKLSWWKFINMFVRLFQSRARNQALATSTKMFRVSTVWVVQPAIMLNQPFFSFWHFYSGQGSTAWSQVTVTRAPYFSGVEVVKFLIDLCNTWTCSLLRVKTILIQEKSTFAKHWKQLMSDEF